MLNLPKEIQFIISTIEAHGYEAYAVGGCVRDMLCGKIPDDYDITTSANPHAVEDMFERTVPTGIKHGTVTVIVGDRAVEVTTFRCDGDYTDRRRPDSVKFVPELKQDLARRDFTVNALAYNDRLGVCDFYGGSEDIKSRVLRAVGDPEKRFCEDALRILRLFRFSCTLGFTSETGTLNSALKHLKLLEDISRERIFTELLKSVCSDNPERLTLLIKENGLAFLGITRAGNLKILKALEPRQDLRLFAFLYLCADDINTALEALKVSNRAKEYCRKMLIVNSAVIKVKADIKNLLFKTSPEIFADFLAFQTAVGNDTFKEKRMFNEIIINREPYKIKELAINGKDLEKIGISGKKVGETLEKLRKAVVLDPSENTRGRLIEKTKQNIGN